MDFKIGDKVRIADGIVADDTGIETDWDSIVNSVMTIANIEGNSVDVEENGFIYESKWLTKVEDSSNVDHPSHYNQGGIECLDAMIAAFGKESVKEFCICNAFKYIFRFKLKNGMEDIAKALWYLNKYKELSDET